MIMRRTQRNDFWFKYGTPRKMFQFHWKVGINPSRIDILREAQSTECVPECNGMWLTCAKQVLRQNGINLPGHSRTLWKNLFTRDKENAEILWLSGLLIAGKLSSWTLWALFTIPFAIPRIVRLLGLVLNTPNASSWMISGGLSKSFPGMTSF